MFAEAIAALVFYGDPGVDRGAHHEEASPMSVVDHH